MDCPNATIAVVPPQRYTCVRTCPWDGRELFERRGRVKQQTSDSALLFKHAVEPENNCNVKLQCVAHLDLDGRDKHDDGVLGRIILPLALRRIVNNEEVLLCSRAWRVSGQ